jgi:hypothetical protein
MIVPALQCLGLLRLISGSIINSRDACARAGDVTQDCFDDMRITPRSPSGGARSSQIVNAPFRDFYRFLESRFRVAPYSESAPRQSENVFAAVLLPHL